jgi:hypothetical protein
VRVLIGYSRCQLTRAAFERHGHDVWTCDLLPAPGKHLQCDIWHVAEIGNWDMAIFHPMCTYLTVAAAWAFNDPDYERYPGIGYHQKVKPDTLVGEARREARREALNNFRRLLALPYPKAIENPAHSFIHKAIRPADQRVQPYEFGDDASKETGFWLDRLPPLAPTKRVAGRLVPRNKSDRAAVTKTGSESNETHDLLYLERWSNQTDTGQNRLSPSEDRWLERSATYPGIAAAMGDQWGRRI